MKLKYRVIERFRRTYSVAAMCEVFDVSRSGYYAWRKRQERPAKDQWLADLIVECQKKCKQTYGIRRVRSTAAQSVLGYGYHLHPDSRQYAVYVRCARPVREGCAELENRL